LVSRAKTRTRSAIVALTITSPSFYVIILKDAKPSETRRPAAYKICAVINLKTAKALGLTTLGTLLARADKVIE
jgi:ABC-type uncharacterized transport system substrate-binding protein